MIALTLGLMVLAMGSMGCGSCVVAPKKQASLEQLRCVSHERIENIERVFMHLPGQYTLLMPSGDLRALHGNFKILRDATAQKTWVDICLPAAHVRLPKSGTIYLGNPRDLQGAGWRIYDKHSRQGMTEEVR